MLGFGATVLIAGLVLIASSLTVSRSAHSRADASSLIAHALAAGENFSLKFSHVKGTGSTGAPSDIAISSFRGA